MHSQNSVRLVLTYYWVSITGLTLVKRAKFTLSDLTISVMSRLVEFVMLGSSC